jgi:hypothetical protein
MEDLKYKIGTCFLCLCDICIVDKIHCCYINNTTLCIIYLTVIAKLWTVEIDKGLGLSFPIITEQVVKVARM